MQQLIDRVIATDYSVINAVKDAGPAVVPALDSLTSDADAEVRELALLCLSEVGSPPAIEAFIRLLLDPEATVRAAAMRGLHRHLSKVSVQSAAAFSGSLYVTYDRSNDPVVRQNVALILGKAPGASPEELEQRLKTESNGIVQEGCIVALARLGKASAQSEYGNRLQHSSGRDRARLLEYGFYIHQTWLLPWLLPLLDDQSVALRIGVDDIGLLPEYLRICDLAVVLIQSISGRSFSFPIDRKTNFTELQLAEVRAWGSRLP